MSRQTPSGLVKNLESAKCRRLKPAQKLGDSEREPEGSLYRTSVLVRK
jgi:hypothetical protein